jgi:diguanylate cyclase (GGDEF)-like protein/PAS domain S-box-containing protein
MSRSSLRDPPAGWVEGRSILALVARAMPSRLWTVDRDLIFTSWAGQGFTSTGADATLPSSPVQAFGDSDSQAIVIAAHERALEGVAVSFELECGGRLLRAFIEPQRNAIGEITGALGFAFDATDEQRMLSTLRRSEETLALAQTAANLGSWTHDLDSGEATWSNELYALCGIEPHEPVTPALLWCFVHADDRLALEAALEVAREERRPFVVDARLIRADGRERWVQHRGLYRYSERGPIQLIGTVLDITARKRAEAQIEQQVNFDELTGLPNRKLLVERLQQTLFQAQQGDHAAALLYLDLDRFEAINDTLGHNFGDEFLRLVAPRLTSVLGAGDTVSRVGGDEFVIVLPAISSIREARRAAERVIEAFARPVSVQGRDLYSSVSVGISIFPDDGSTPEELIRSSDAALHRAKAGGNGTFRFYAAATHDLAVDRLELENDLRRAFEREEFVLHYQPIVDRFERPVALEALLRWEHPRLGTLSPDRFISLSEEIGLIVPLGRWVLQTAIAQLARLDRAGAPTLRMALNISGRQILDPELGASLRDAIAAQGLDPSRIDLEITESVVMGDVPGARRAIADLKAFGVSISLDDFGTGYNALSYLKHFHVNALKIDRTFIRDLPQDRGDAAIVSAVVALGHAMGLGVVAEGVENREQADLVRRLGCDEMQGYYFARPLGPADLEGVLRSWSR